MIRWTRRMLPSVRLRAVEEGKTKSVNGGDVVVRADCICVHSDTPNAVEVARPCGPR